MECFPLTSNDNWQIKLCSFLLLYPRSQRAEVGINAGEVISPSQGTLTLRSHTHSCTFGASPLCFGAGGIGQPGGQVMLCLACLFANAGCMCKTRLPFVPLPALGKFRLLNPIEIISTKNGLIVRQGRGQSTLALPICLRGKQKSAASIIIYCSKFVKCILAT